MANEPKIDAEWRRAGKVKMLFANVPLEHYGSAPDPIADPATFQKWAAEFDDRLHEIADGKVSEHDQPPGFG